MGPISMMAWRIGDILDIDKQIGWIEEHGFDGLSFHASGGSPGQWQGMDPDGLDKESRLALRARLGEFEVIEIHAPFSAPLTLGKLERSLPQLKQTVAFAHDVGASVVTVHADVPEDPAERSIWQQAAILLDGVAMNAEVYIGLEITSGFSALRDIDLDATGITLDVGHMYHHDAAPLQSFGGDIGAVVEMLGDDLIHLHLHDVVGSVDHVMPGTGCVDWERLFASLAVIDYQGMYCLELNPGRVSPEGILESRNRIVAYANEAELKG